MGLLPKLGFWHLGELYKPGAKVMREHFIFIENTFYVQRTRDMICGVHAGSTDSKDRACSGHIISIKDTFYVQRNAKKKREGTHNLISMPGNSQKSVSILNGMCSL